MTLQEGRRPEYIYMNGELTPYDDARVHVLSTGFKYGASVYEGVRGYWSDEQEELFLFRLDDHISRLMASSKITRIPVPQPPSELSQAAIRLVEANGLKEDVHIRILCFVAADDGLLSATEPVSWAVAAMPMGRYPERRREFAGLHVSISHWQRIADAATPPRVKIAGNYVNSRLALLQALADGYDDAVLLDSSGQITEGPGYNIFLSRMGRIVTPPVTAGILEGITRDSIIQLLNHLHGIEVNERPIDKTELYVADEAFFCGSAKEVMPLLSVDHIPLGSETPGPITRLIAQSYFEAVRGRLDQFRRWLTPVYSQQPIRTNDRGEEAITRGGGV